MTAKEKCNLINLPTTTWIFACLYLALTIAFLFFFPGYQQERQTAFGWLISSWFNFKKGYSIGFPVALISIGLFVHSVRKIRNHVPSPSLAGLISTALGAFLCVVSVRTQQPRLAWLAFPLLYGGLSWCYWGFYATRKTIFPFFYFWLTVPVPFLEQYTTGMQHLSAQLAHWGAGLFGVQTILEGTNVISADGTWDAFDIAGGCSGLRSLSVLLVLSLCWAYLADKLSGWKRIVLALSAFPISILTNALRVTSIFVCAEYVSADFAGKTWHDWSGLLLFFPASLLCLAILHSLLSGEILLLKKRKIVTRRHNTDTPS